MKGECAPRWGGARRRQPVFSIRSLVFVAGSWCTVTAALGAQGFEGADFQKMRDGYFESRMAYPFPRIPEGALDRMRQAITRQSLGSIASLSLGNWTPAGPGGLFAQDGFFSSSPQADAGRVDAIALHPTSAGTMYLAAPGGGIWKTANRGDSWSPMSDQLCSLRMGTVTLDPVNPNIVYAGVASSSASPSCALFRSVNGGLTWSSTGIAPFSSWSGGITQVHIDRSTAGNTATSTLVVAATFGIMRSTTGGQTWTAPFPLTGEAYSIVELPAVSGVLFTAISDGSNSNRNGLYRSADNGVTWTQMPTGALPFAQARRFQLAISPAEPNSVWIVASNRNDSRMLGMWKWDNVTQQFTTLAANGVYTGEPRGDFGAQASYDLVLAVDPGSAQVLYAGGVRLFKSTNAGASFKQIAQNIHVDWHALVIDPANPRHLLGGSDGGVFVSFDGGDTWIGRNNNLAITQHYPGLALHPSNATILLGGSQDNGSQISNGTMLWNGVTGGDGGFAAINYANPSIIWTTCQWLGDAACIYRRSPDVNFGFPTFRRNGIAGTDRAVFIPPFQMDPVTPTTLYFGTQRLYRTVDDGLLWSAVSGDLSKGSGAISTIAVAKSNPQVIYVGTSDGNLQVSRDGGATFTLSNAGLPNRFFTRIAVDVQDPNRAVVTAGGFLAGHAFLTADGGVTWTNISGALADAPLYAVVLINGTPNHMFVGGDLGVFETTDAGGSWSRTPGGMPNATVQDLAYNPTLQLLVAATYGRGMFSYSLANPAAVLRGDVDRNGTVNAFDALLTQQSLVGIALAPELTSVPHGDTNCNSSLEAADALITLRAAVGLTTTGACVGTNR